MVFHWKRTVLKGIVATVLLSGILILSRYRGSIVTSTSSWLTKGVTSPAALDTGLHPYKPEQIHRPFSSASVTPGGVDAGVQPLEAEQSQSGWLSRRGKGDERRGVIGTWVIANSSRRPDEVRHIVFIKVHKAASTTVFSVLIRFATARDLNVMFPARGHILSKARKRPLTERGLTRLPPSPPFLFDVLCNHVLFDAPLVSRFFPPDTVLMGVVREPWGQVRSAFYYYTTAFHTEYLKKVHVSGFDEFITQQSRYEPEDPYGSFTNNRQSLDLGLDPGYLGNASRVQPFVRRLDKQFRLMLITERFPESMILLKRTLNWTLKDVLFFNINGGKAQQEAPSFEPDEAERARFQRFQMFDVAVYRHFLRVFERKVAEHGPDFEDEIRLFRNVLTTVAQFCSNKTAITTTEPSGKAQSQSPALVIPGSRWNDQFTLTSSECGIMRMKERRLNEAARKRQLERLFPSA